jgi:DNA-binding beta-propeller fold protein YncE
MSSLAVNPAGPPGPAPRPRRDGRIAALLFAAALVGGCGRPAGTLFGDAGTRVWPPAPERTRIRAVGALRSSSDLKAAVSAGEAFATVLRGERPPIAFSAPHGIAREGTKLAVADTGLAGVHILDLEARTHTLVNGCRQQRFETPLGVTWADGRLFVTDAGRHEVVELDASGACRASFGAEVLKRPVGIVYLPPRNELLVVDGGAHALVGFNPSGGVTRRIGSHGSGPGDFNYPTHIGFDGHGRFAVADTANFRVQLLDLDGRPLGSIGKKGDAAGDLSLPKGVAFDSEGHLYVVDTHFENVQIFDGEGRLLLAFGEEGTDLGRFGLPAGIAIDPADRIWVAEAANHRVQVFDYLPEDGSKVQGPGSKVGD